MRPHLDNPLFVFAIARIAQGIAVYIGDILRRRSHQFREDERHDFDAVRATTMTRLVLIIGFTFSMAVSRYDQRKTLQEAEANAIGTEFLRADLLPDDRGTKARALLREYLRLWVAVCENDDEPIGQQIDQHTAASQRQFWTVLRSAAARQPTPVVALAVAGMDDVLNSQGYTLATWRNRIPIGARALMGIMPICCNLLVGYGERREGGLIVFIPPVVVSISFSLSRISIALGAIRVYSQALLAASQSMKAP